MKVRIIQEQPIRDQVNDPHMSICHGNSNENAEDHSAKVRSGKALACRTLDSFRNMRAHTFILSAHSAYSLYFP